MDDFVAKTLFGAGLACCVGAVVGGGFGAAGFTVPVLNSKIRQVLLFALGLAMAFVSFYMSTPGFFLTPALAGPWDAVGQFSHTMNPNGQWKYLTNSLPLESIKNYEKNNKVDGWWTNQPVPNSIYILQNSSGETGHYGTVAAPADHLWMDPESGSVTARWTAPASGTFRVSGDFLGIDTNENGHPVVITNGQGDTLFADNLEAYGQISSFDLKQTLESGQTINFTATVGPNGDYFSLSTGLKVMIKQIK